MSKVWRRLQRVGKKAFKFRYTTYSHALEISCDSKWQPDKICLSWTRRGRKYSSKVGDLWFFVVDLNWLKFDGNGILLKLGQWEPGLNNLYEGVCRWDKSSDFIEFDATLYKNLNDNSYEEKEWCLLVESEEAKGKRRLLASAKLNLEQYANNLEAQYQIDVNNIQLKCESSKIKSASISFHLACQFIKEGKAT